MSTDLKPGTRVQAILLDRNDDALVDLPGMEGVVVPVSEWPVTLPDEWTDENTVIVRWDDPERLRFTPYRPDVAARVLRVLDDAPTAPPTGVVEVITQGISPFSPGTRGKVVEKPANAPEHDGLVRVQFDGGHDWYFLPRSLRSVPTDPSTPAQDHGPLAAVLSDRTLAKVLSRPAYDPPSPTKDAIVEAAIRWYEIRNAHAADVTPLQLFDADDALNMAVKAHRAAVQS